MHSVLFLILTFFNAAALLFLFNVEFLGLIFLIIYVGAIAVLFLFVIMMLNVKTNLSIKFFNLPLIIITCAFVLIQTFYLIKDTFTPVEIVFQTTKIEFFLDKLNSIDVLGQGLYNYYIICFLIAGLILLVAMIGAIALTLNYKSGRKNELVIRQLSRSDNFLAFSNI